MFHRILGPLTADATAAGALRIGRAFAQEVGAELIELPITAEAIERQRQTEIFLAAEAERADLIILPLGAHPAHEAKGAISALAKSLPAAPAPVMLAPRSLAEGSSLLPLSLASSMVIVPLDGTASAERALPYASALAEQFNRVLLLVRVVPPSLHMESAEVSEQWAREAREGRRYLRAARQRTQAQTSVAVETMQLHGDVAQALARLIQVHEASVLVFHAHDERGLDRLFHTNVTDELLRRVQAPMLVIPAAPRSVRAGERLGAATLLR